MTKVKEIENFWPSKKSEIARQSFRPKKMRATDLANLVGAILFVVVVVLSLNWMIDTFFTVARAQVIELKNCQTNKQCCELYLAGNHGHVMEESVIKGCL